jgi:hypothetical protein
MSSECPVRKSRWQVSGALMRRNNIQPQSIMLGHVLDEKPMFRSLRGRLLVLLVLLVGASVAAGALMVGLFHQSATAQAGQAEAEIGRACDAITSAYRFYATGWQAPPNPTDVSFMLLSKRAAAAMFTH